MLKGILNKKTVDEEKVIAQKKLMSAQQWLPLKDINNQFMYFKDNSIAMSIWVEPINIYLFIENEQKNIIQKLYEAFNGASYSFNIYSIPKPLDLDHYIINLRNKQEKEENFNKRKLYSGYIQVAAKKATSGDDLERAFYIIIRQEHEKYGEKILRQKVEDFVGELSLESHICSDQELRDLNFIFTHPAQAAIEKAPEDYYSLPIMYSKEGV